MQDVAQNEALGTPVHVVLSELFEGKVTLKESCGQQVELWLPSEIKPRQRPYLHCGITLFQNYASQPHKTFPKRMELSRQQRSFRKGFVRLIGANSETKKPPTSLLGLQTVLMAAASAL